MTTYDSSFDESKSITSDKDFTNTDASFEDQLIEIYWAKKELEEFLPKIATYASPTEIAAITLSQLSMMERQIVSILKSISKNNDK